ncbi:MAG TPA: hypothetical protein PLI93_11715 [Gemmatimonadales bacterium]|nr:hypothetical protein [Gemmatimonadales bacterium]
MASPTCVACGRPFPANGTLAALPDGRRIAFDPEHGRVWRICTHCREWNLLGQEAAARALPELGARFQAAAKAGSLDGSILAHLGTTDLIQLGTHTAPVPNEVASLKRRSSIERGWWIFIVVGGAWLLWGLRNVWDTLSDPAELWTRLPAMLMLLGSVSLIQAGIQRRFSRHESSALPAPVGYALFLAGAVLVLWQYPTWWPSIPITAAVVALAARYLSSPVTLTVELGQDRTLDFRGSEPAAVTLSWTGTPPELTLHDLPGGATATGEDARAILRELLEFHTIAPRRVTEQAWTLMRSVGGLHGVLQALDGFRQEASDRIVIDELPLDYLVALDLALAAESVAETDPTLPDAASIAAAREVAEIAESLDEEPA